MGEKLYLILTESKAQQSELSNNLRQLWPGRLVSLPDVEHSPAAFTGQSWYSSLFQRCVQDLGGLGGGQT